jgi:hypothetical protein
MLKDEEWFFVIHKQQIKQTGMSITEIRSCKSKLRKAGIIRTKCMGIPSKEWYRIDQEQILEMLEVPLISRHKDSQSLGVRFPDAITNNNKVNNNNLPIQGGSDFPIVPNLFEKFWKIYPKTAGKGAALTAWSKLCNKSPKDRPTWRTIRKAIKAQKESERWKYSIQQIPQASTWLNQSRWLDDPTQMKAFIDKTAKELTKIRYGRSWALRDNGHYYNKDGERLIE